MITGEYEAGVSDAGTHSITLIKYRMLIRFVLFTCINVVCIIAFFTITMSL